jgi:hypothetical protein
MDARRLPAPTTPSASATVSTLSAGVDTLRLFAGGTSVGTTSTEFDEIKLGTTYSDVI